MGSNPERHATGWSRREWIAGGASAAALAPSAARAAVARTPESERLLRIDPEPRHELSPYLFMQFMEPLGATDGSVEAVWDHLQNAWRDDFVRVTQELAPTLMRWGGIYSDYYRWREGVGPRGERPPLVNLLWGGIESNQVGTAEFVDLCRQVGADPLMCVNFESDGRKRYKRYGDDVRTADAREAAEWVAYCNRPGHALRAEHGCAEPHNIRLWQLGNETSYDRSGFDLETAARKTVEFADAMRGADPDIELIGWGDSGWAGRMIEATEGRLQYVAFHHMFNPDRRDPVLAGLRYLQDPDRTWGCLMDAHRQHERKIVEARQWRDGYDTPLAMTECHFAIPDRDRCEVLSTWAAGVAYARMLNVHSRHGDALKIATAADFCGNRWQVNAVMVPTPRERGRAYLMPVAKVMGLYRRHVGERFLATPHAPDGLDVTASRTGDTVYVHAVNTNRTRSVRADLAVEGLTIGGGSAYQIAAPPEESVTDFNADAMPVEERDVPAGGAWEFPAASVTALELDCLPA